VLIPFDCKRVKCAAGIGLVTLKCHSSSPALLSSWNQYDFMPVKQVIHQLLSHVKIALNYVKFVLSSLIFVVIYT
jgi:hypothetical protein